MHCVVAIEGRFTLRDGRPASHHLTYERFWQRYLTVFDSITVLGRLFSTEDPVGGQVEGPGVTFAPLPGYSGPLQFLRCQGEVKAQVRAVCTPESAFILRVPGNIGTLVWEELRRTGHPYGVEVVGDPYDAFAPGAMTHPLRSVFRWWYTRQMRAQCAGAVAASYVTEYSLQRRYPPAADAFTTHYSSIELPDAAIVAAPRPAPARGEPITVIQVGGLNTLQKGQDTLIDAVAACVRQGLDLRLIFVGDGKLRAMLEAQVAAQGLTDRVVFRGQVSGGAAVWAELDQADLFVLPSRQEGLPRGMIEAMARALPCLGSTVGGIPELLPMDCLVPPDQPAALAQVLARACADPDDLARLSARNLEVARAYRSDLLMARRRDYYQALVDRTSAWLQASPTNSSARKGMTP